MSTKEDLMNSLMGNGGTTILPASEEEDLFGGIPVVPSSVTNEMASNPEVISTNNTIVTPTEAPPQVALPTPTSATSTLSLLATSGLLVSDDGGGLFDEIDKEAEMAAAAAEEAKRAKEAAELEAQKAAVAAQAEAQRAAQAAQEEAERIRRQQVQDQMQSIHLGGPMPPQNMPYGGGGGLQPQLYNNSGYPPPQQPQQQQQQQFQPHQTQYNNMYPPPQQQYPSHQPYLSQQQYQVNNPHTQDTNPAAKHVPEATLYQVPNSMVPANQTNSRYYQPSMIGSPTAGMYNGISPRNYNSNLPPHQQENFHAAMQSPQAMMQPTRPMAVAPGFYSRILVTEPLLLQSSPGGLFGIGQPPHWSYQITTELNPNVQQQQQQNGGGHQGVWMVRRRFRHVVALEDRLRDDCPGAILPPR
jgi:hypothetical protein